MYNRSGKRLQKKARRRNHRNSRDPHRVGTGARDISNRGLRMMIVNSIKFVFLCFFIRKTSKAVFFFGGKSLALAL